MQFIKVSGGCFHLHMRQIVTVLIRGHVKLQPSLKQDFTVTEREI